MQRGVYMRDATVYVSSLCKVNFSRYLAYACCLQYWRGGRFGKSESHAVTCLDVWRSGTFPEKQQVSECTTIANADCRTTECSTSDSLGDVSWMKKAKLQLY